MEPSGDQIAQSVKNASAAFLRQFFKMHQYSLSGLHRSHIFSFIKWIPMGQVNRKL